MFGPGPKSRNRVSNVLIGLLYIGWLSWINPRKALSSLLYAGLVGFGYSIYLTYPGRLAYLYGVLAVVFTTLMIWVFFDMRSHIRDQNRYEELETDIEKKHFLCGDPLCDRCQGYWIGLFSTAFLTLILYQRIIEILNVYEVNPVLLVVVGAAIFIVTTPLHGIIKNVIRVLFKDLRVGGSLTKKKLNYLLGFLSGLSMSAMVIGLLMVLP